MQDTMNFGFQLLQMAGSLALVLGLLVAALYGLKRWGHWVKRSTGSDAWIDIVAKHPFSPKHYLLVVKVQEQLLLLGISPQGMHFLTHLSHPPEGKPITEDMHP